MCFLLEHGNNPHAVCEAVLCELRFHVKICFESCYGSLSVVTIQEDISVLKLRTCWILKPVIYCCELFKARWLKIIGGRLMPLLNSVEVEWFLAILDVTVGDCIIPNSFNPEYEYGIWKEMSANIFIFMNGEAVVWAWACCISYDCCIFDEPWLMWDLKLVTDIFNVLKKPVYAMNLHCIHLEWLRFPPRAAKFEAALLKRREILLLLR